MPSERTTHEKFKVLDMTRFEFYEAEHLTHSASGISHPERRLQCPCHVNYITYIMSLSITCFDYSFP